MNVMYNDFGKFSKAVLSMPSYEISDTLKSLFTKHRVNKFIIMSHNIYDEGQIKNLIHDLNRLYGNNTDIHDITTPMIMIDVEGGGFDKNKVLYSEVKKYIDNDLALRNYLSSCIVGVNRLASLDITSFINDIKCIDISLEEKFLIFIRSFKARYFYPSNRDIGILYENGDCVKSELLLASKMNAISIDLKMLGFNYVCAPVADLMVEGVDNMLVRKERLFSTSPDITLTLTQMSVDILNANGITPIVKHLLGHGMTVVDSHYVLPKVYLDIKELKKHFSIFSNLRHVSHFMVSHIDFHAIDNGIPLTLSKKGVDYIRNHVLKDIKNLVLISDAIEMGALYEDNNLSIILENIGEISQKMINVGIDNIICCLPEANKSILESFCTSV